MLSHEARIPKFMDTKPTQENPDSASLRSGDLFGLAAPYFKPPFKYMHGTIWDATSKVVDMRGWGHLTGGGAHGLPHDKAAKIQDQLGEHLAQLMNAHWPNVEVSNSGPKN